MVGLGRLELPTPRLSSVCSNQLSYRPICCVRVWAPSAGKAEPPVVRRPVRRRAIEDRGTAVRTYPNEERET